jgi:hypothetical protein
MTELADFVVIDRNRQELAAGGKWTSPQFQAGGRKVLRVGGTERHNAYITMTFRVASGTPGAHINIRIIVNAHPLPELVFGVANTMNTTMAAFPGSFLRDGTDNVVELHSQGELAFILTHAVVHFKQDS